MGGAIAGGFARNCDTHHLDHGKLAESMGWWAKGPIKDPADLGPALKLAVAAVKSGQPALLNVWTQPR